MLGWVKISQKLLISSSGNLPNIVQKMKKNSKLTEIIADIKWNKYISQS